MTKKMVFVIMKDWQEEYENSIVNAIMAFEDDKMSQNMVEALNSSNTNPDIEYYIEEVPLL